MIAAAPPGRVASQREVARRLGVSHTALQKAQRAGRIAPEPDGAWDVEKVRARLAESSDPARRTGAMAAPAAPPLLPPARPVAPPAPAPPPAAPDPLPRAAGSTFHDARTANEVLKAQERRLRLDERKGKLVDKARALLLVHRLAKEERDAILAWPARVAAEMAAELGVDAHRLQTMMDARLRQHLAERHDVRVSVG
ncbi:hypothetical protein GCM10010964_42140 [Caldovatus sediminis]|uniref:Elements of external origin n=1 Tax=Caldovatus sediminis TaxID=2041189 RepID=A0A8J2ZEY9_9PROT|nr:elements of external origin [Caldovatus sediminis]GGG50418.1 hypothetical protein GCM10010964_42140 [Caldovatus sediminis]